MSRLASPAGTSPRSAPVSTSASQRRGARIGCEVELEAVLAGVAGARDEHGLALERGREGAVVLDRVQVGDEVVDVVARSVVDAEAGRLLQHGAGVGALQGDQGDVVALVGDERVESGRAGAELVGDDPGVRGVRDDHVAVVAGAVDDEVVDDAAVLGEQQRVLRLADLDRRELAGERVVERGGRARSEQDDLAHVREVEEAGRRAHGVVLGEVARVAHGHLPAREVGERGAGGAMHRVEGASTFDGAGFGGAGVGHEFSRVAWAVGGCRWELPLCHGA